MSNVPDSLYNDLNKSSDFWTKHSPAIKFDGKYEVVIVDCFLKNTHDIPRKRFKKGKKHLITHQSLLSSEVKNIILVKEDKETKSKKNVGLKKHFSS